MQIDTTKLNVGELELIQTQYNGDLGNFKTALWEAIRYADQSNLKRLSTAFPEQVAAYVKFTSVQGYWQEVLVRAGLVKEPPAEAETETH
jgi:hypothetical protein